MEQPSPTPWSVSHGNLIRVNAQSSEEGWEKPVVVCGVHRIGRLTGKERDGQALANARLIVTAVNSFEPLVSALEAVANRYDETYSPHCEERHLGDLARHALSLAREGRG